MISIPFPGDQDGNSLASSGNGFIIAASTTAACQQSTSGCPGAQLLGLDQELLKTWSHSLTSTGGVTCDDVTSHGGTNTVSCTFIGELSIDRVSTGASNGGRASSAVLQIDARGNLAAAHILVDTKAVTARSEGRTTTVVAAQRSDACQGSSLVLLSLSSNSSPSIVGSIQCQGTGYVSPIAGDFIGASILVVGATIGKVTIEGKPLADAGFLARFEGNRLEWIQTLTAQSRSALYRVATGTDGQSAVVGQTVRGAQFGSHRLEIPESGRSSFVALVDAGGEPNWATPIDDSLSAWGLVRGPDGSIYSAVPVSTGIQIRKLDSVGTVLWQEILGPLVGVRIGDAIVKDSRLWILGSHLIEHDRDLLLVSMRL